MSSIQRHEVLQMLIATRRSIAATLELSPLAAVSSQRVRLNAPAEERKSILHLTRLRYR
ncbi:hypothetical protein [Lonsdalea quercina]|uniref:hypothetical protein n=1 Tax=Lonsdalea quercina TaxID=71657 RepID=UPI001362C168|nr:hypothetical protein [Lonsdalea quercina]